MGKKKATGPAGAGWYPHPDFPGSVRYWDGESWTDRIAPAPSDASSGPSVRKIALGVALGIGAVLALLSILASCEREEAWDAYHDCIDEHGLTSTLCTAPED